MTPEVSRVFQAAEARGCRPRQKGDGFKALCPCCQSDGAQHDPGLSVTAGREQPVILRCHGPGRCGVLDVVAGLGLEPGDVCNERAPKIATRPRQREVARWSYTDENGAPLFDAVRLEPGQNGRRKTFRQHLPGRTSGGIGKTRRVLYRLPDVLAAVSDGWTVCVCEGERCADAINADPNTDRLFATTPPGGAPAFDDRLADALVGAARVVVWRDRDEAGAERARRIVAALVKRAIPHVVVESPHAHDAADHLAAGHSLTDVRSVEDRGDEPNATELGLAERLVTKYGADLRYCFPWSCWLVWNGERWDRDRMGRVRELVKGIIPDLHAEAAREPEPKQRERLARFACTAEKEPTIRHAVALACSSVAEVPEAFDADAWNLNTPSGTVDLRTGDVRAHRRADLLTKLCPTPYDPNATAPTFEAFLLRIMGGDVEMVLYLQRLFGYALTGSCREHILAMLIGKGANGKSTLTGAIQRTLGQDYAVQVAPALLFHDRTDTHPTGLADLQGRRVAVTHELDSGTRLAEGLVKSMTGGDPIKARRMRQDYFEFVPTHTLFLAANSRPVVRGTDDGIWRRLRLVPFRVQIPEGEQDRELPATLDAEASGILAWIVAGAAEWQRLGLAEPAPVREATAAYRTDEDVLGAFLADECDHEPDGLAPAGELYQLFKTWCEREVGGQPWTQTTFGRRLTDRGIEAKKIGGAWQRVGVVLR